MLQHLKIQKFKNIHANSEFSPKTTPKSGAIAKGFTSFNSWWKESCVDKPEDKS